MGEQLTERQGQVLRQLSLSWSLNGTYGPTLDEIGAALDMSRERVRQHLSRLKELGRVCEVAEASKSRRWAPSPEEKA